MNETDLNRLQDILAQFDTQALGEGDVSVGTNVLATMAITLANLARPGSGILSKDRFTRVGCNLLVTGARLIDMVQDEVVNPVVKCQDNILSHVHRLLVKDEEQKRNPTLGRHGQLDLANGKYPSQSEENFMTLMASNRMNPPIDSNQQMWIDVVSNAPIPYFGDLARSPRIFIADTDLKRLHKQLGMSHDRQALVNVVLNNTSDVGRYSELCSALINGLMPLRQSGTFVRGKMLVTDSANLLPSAVRNASDQPLWLERLVWLVTSNAGPEYPSCDAINENVIRLPYVIDRFEFAAQEIIAQRMNNRETQHPLVLEIEFSKRQIRWMGFLSSMESSFPGISGSARHLLASLVFGLRWIVRTGPVPEGFKHRMDGIEALAKFLVLRMANARASILFSSAETKKLAIKQKIISKLSDGCLDLRSIYRPLHLAADTCEAILLEMQAENLVKRTGRSWQHINSAAMPSTPNQQLPLDV